jgi:hypothetical protein
VRRKALKNTAFTLCHMFRGWQLLNDYDALSRLGSGTLKIDVLGGECRHNGTAIKALNIVKALGAYFEEDLARHHVPLETVKEALLTVDLVLGRHEGQRNLNRVWAHPTREFVSCALVAYSRVRTDELSYSAEYRDEIEWPVPGAA